MDRSSRFGVPPSPGEANPGEFVLLALVVSVMSAVKAESEQGLSPQHAPDPNVAALLEHLPVPATHLTPGQVVKIQLSAFKVNDAADQGVRKAYEFASPASRLLAGPMERFSVLVRNPVYAPLLNFESVVFGPLEIVGDEAEQRVSILASSGIEATYSFKLSRQSMGAFAGCWMTDRLEPV
jgi:hypothetical protein